MMGPDESPEKKPEPEPDPLLEPISLNATPEALLPRFDEFCAGLGHLREPSWGEQIKVETFPHLVQALFLQRTDTGYRFQARVLKSTAITGWDGEPKLVVAADWREPKTGHSALPLSIAHDERNPIQGPAFWSCPPEETFSNPAGIIAEIPQNGMLTEITPFLSMAAQAEAFRHASGLAVRLDASRKADPRFSHASFPTGSIILESMLYQIEHSHQLGDPNVKVDGAFGPAELSDFMASGIRGPIIGVERIHIRKNGDTHEVGVLAFDPRIPLDSNELVLARNVLLRKVYQLQIDSEGGLLSDPKVTHVWIEPYQLAS
jgi:hypothetical protein